ncbi:hypothetical protein BCR32DRAFT_328934 [Anaeromyces robustus]|uniref:CBM1 domain-containing protein n=1 Tax=Anaeromyces robustus TaxID=1754192 RepID=A0A1Y1WVD6_9FUNG|nr:hypothetical protein BCR32DRAFT_328934 [Anaeromyces robustus]|eukprot:ORX77422.1 hypothetical protein BCR32DRAFT_328934 [Anaeromyces robustus]
MKSLTLISYILLVFLSSINAQSQSSKTLSGVPKCQTTKQVKNLCNSVTAVKVFTLSGNENGKACTYTTKCIPGSQVVITTTTTLPAKNPITTTTTTTTTLPAKTPTCQTTKAIKCDNVTAPVVKTASAIENGKKCTYTTKCVPSGSPITTTTTTTTLPAKTPTCQTTKAIKCDNVTAPVVKTASAIENGKKCTYTTKCVPSSSPITTTTTTTTLPAKTPTCQTTKAIKCDNVTAPVVKTASAIENGKKCTYTTKCVPSSSPITTTTTTTTLPAKTPTCQTTKAIKCDNVTAPVVKTASAIENGKKCTYTTKCVPSSSPITTTTTTTTLPAKTPTCQTTKAIKCDNVTAPVVKTASAIENGKKCTYTTKCVPSGSPITTTTTTTTLPAKTPTCQTTKAIKCDNVTAPVVKTASAVENGKPCTYTTKCLPSQSPSTDCVPQTVTVKVTETVTVTVKSYETVTPDVPTTCARKWEQCGGQGFNGPTCCESGSSCQRINEYYSQCI